MPACQKVCLLYRSECSGTVTFSPAGHKAELATTVSRQLPCHCQILEQIGPVAKTGRDFVRDFISSLDSMQSWNRHENCLYSESDAMFLGLVFEGRLQKSYRCHIFARPTT